MGLMELLTIRLEDEIGYQGVCVCMERELWLVRKGGSLNLPGYADCRGRYSVGVSYSSRGIDRCAGEVFLMCLYDIAGTRSL